MADLSLQRHNMVESQVRPSDVTDRRILRAMADIPREAFIEPERRALAYLDIDLPISARGALSTPGRAMLAPRTFAKLVQLAAIEPTDIVLDVGCATGYSTAILSRLAQTVVALENDPKLAAEATRTLQSLGVDNAAVVEGPLNAGYPSEGPFDVIVVEGAVSEVPAALLGQLNDGGRLVAILADRVPSRGAVWRRTGTTTAHRDAFDAAAPILPGFEKKPGFVF
jgi:protein-L-isoaspartate(D-aspartate) O-methyltransferase